MTNLISPANKRPCEFAEVRDGFICLRMENIRASWLRAQHKVITAKLAAIEAAKEAA